MASSASLFATTPTVRPLEADPDLAGGLEGNDAERARACLVARRITLDVGVHDPREAVDAEHEDLGVLVLEGLLVRGVVIFRATGSELLGKGDVLRPWDQAVATPADVAWRVLEPLSLAVLDRAFVRVASRWPEVLQALTVRGIARAQSIAVGLTICGITGLPLRLHVLLWHLADRHGVVRADGVALPLPLTHQVLGRLVGASRPSVTTAMRELEAEGAVAKLVDGGWLLLGPHPLSAS